MFDPIMKLLATQPLRKEPKDSSDVLQGSAGTLRITGGLRVKIGDIGPVTEALDDREVTWVFVEAIEGDDADKKKGFVSSRFLVRETTDVPIPGGFQPFSTRVDKLVFAQACYLQSMLSNTNPAYLYALAFALSGNKWSDTEIQTNDPGGAFRFTTEAWQSLITEPEAVGVQSDQIKFPIAQCIVAAIVAAKAADLLQGLITNRGVSAVDLLLAHLFADNNNFGANAAASILQAETDNDGQKSDMVVEARIFPDNAFRAAFFQRNADIFNSDGSATIAEALKACADKLNAGFAEVAAIAKKLDDQNDPNLQDCQISVFSDNIPQDPKRDPVLGGGGPVSGGGGDVSGGGPGQAGGGITESQERPNVIRNLPISKSLHDILEYAGRKTGIDVEVYSGGQPPAGPRRTGSHRHDVNPEDTLTGAADLHMLDARTGRILDSNNADDRERMADFMAASAAAGATGIGHALGYMGTRSTHIGGGNEAVWGAGNSVAGAPVWVIAAFKRGRARPLTQTQFASELKTLRKAPIQIASPDGVKVLASVRQRFSNELQHPEIHRLIAASTNAEVGGQGAKAEQYYIESVFNRAVARNKTLRQTLTSDNRQGGYYPATTIDKLGDPVPAPKQAQIDQIIASVVTGANESNFATGNESGAVHSGGAPVTRNLGSGKERFVQEIPDKSWIRKVAAAAARGDTNIA